MSTLGALKATIADDLARPNLTNQIAAAITAAIDHYKGERFWFNVTRAETWLMVADRASYTSADDAAVPLFLDLDAMFIEDADGIRYELTRIDPVDMESLLDESASSSRPDSYSYYDETFYFHPIPDLSTYTIRPMGLIEVAAPASDSETGNPWMVYCYQLIRCRAKWDLFAHTIMAPDKAGGMNVMEMDALAELRRKTSRRTATGQIKPTSF